VGPLLQSEHNLRKPFISNTPALWSTAPRWRGAMRQDRKAISVTEALSAFDKISAVEPRRILLAEAIGLRPVEDILIRRSRPEHDVADIDGWATPSGKLAGASVRKPIFLPEVSRHIDKGDPLPSGCDCIVSCEDILIINDRPASRLAVVAGHGVAHAGSLCQKDEIFLKAGTQITINSVIQGTLCGIGQVLVRRPVVDIICNTRDMSAKNDCLIPLVAAAIRGSRASIGAISFTAGDPKELAALIQASSADVIATVGGTGDGPGDTTLEGLSEVCEIIFRGVRIKPGGSVIFSMIGNRPIFSVPGNHLDIQALNAVLTRPLARKAFGRPPIPLTSRQARLATGLQGGKDGTILFFGNMNEGRIQIIEGPDLRPANIASADCMVIVMEGDRHKRAGELVSYLKL
jgi:molybdopterin molybdotransferase